MRNALQLHDAELDALRSLQARRNAADAPDPVWEELEALGLVQLRHQMYRGDGSLTRVASLTPLGRRYRTD